MRTTVLVVDDDPMAGEQLRGMVSVLGCSVVVSQDPGQALEILEERAIDVILCDFWMPGANGQEFYAQVVSRNPQLATRIVFLIGSVLGEETQFFLKSTGNVQLLKPLRLPAVKEAIAAALRGPALAASSPR